MNDDTIGNAMTMPGNGGALLGGSGAVGNDLDAKSMNDAVTMVPEGGLSLGRIDQYELLRELGGGGFGSVFLAKDTVAGIEVAVKGLPPLIRNNVEELERIRENFALVSRLHHPYIAAALHLQLAKEVVYSSEDARQRLRVMPGDTLMVMEYAPGVTLSKWRKQFPDGKVLIEHAVQIARQIAQALDFAHEHHIIHRDIKPANIMVETRADGVVVARLLDFGLAAEVRSSMGRVSREIHDTSGTRPYMAPEQWAGRKQGPATDQYALAVLLYEMLTGEVPFASVFDTGDPMVMMNAVCNQDVEFPEDCPRKAALRRALAKDPSLRFASCMDFLDAVAEVQTRKSHWGLVLCVMAVCILVFGGLCCWLCLENIQAEKKYRKRQADKQAELNANEEKKIRNEELRRENAERARQLKNNEEARIAEQKKKDEKARIAEQKKKDEEARKKREKELDKARDRAKVIAAEIESDIDPMLEKFEARGCIRARDALEAGTRLRNSGKAALKNGDYRTAEEHLAAAKENLSKAASAAKKSMIKPHLDKANNWGSVGEWQRCMDECNTILDLDAANEEAKNLIYEAENHLAQQPERREETVQKRKRVAIQQREQRQISGSVLANEFTIDDANTLSQLGPMSPLVLAKYKKAGEYAMKGSTYMSQAKSEYKKGRDYGGPEWPALEKWLKWWK